MRKLICVRLLGASVLAVGACAGLAHAASSQPDIRIMDFARAADAVTSSRFEQAGFALETRLSSGALQRFTRMDSLARRRIRCKA